MTLDEIRAKGVPIRRMNETILLGKNPPAEVLAFVKEHKTDILFELAAEETNRVVGRMKPARIPTLEHERFKADKDEAWKAMDQAWMTRDFATFETARAKWVVACKRLSEPEST